MASASQWEVVGKSKKTKPTHNGFTKSQKKQYMEKMPRIEPNAPLKEEKSLYSALEEKESPKLDHGNAASARSSDGQHGNNIKKPAVQKKKKPDDGKKQEKPVPLDVALESLDHTDLESILSQSQLRFPDHQEVWLKDLASYLNIKLDRVQETDPTFKGKSPSYPLDTMSKSYTKVLNNFIKKFSHTMLEQVFYYCMQTMLQESAKGNPVYGYKAFLQLLIHHKPNIALGKLPQYLELLKTHQNNSFRCLSILWVVGQCGVKDFKSGLKVWLDLMLPALEVKQVAHYPVDYLEKLVKTHDSLSSGYGVVTLREYFQVLDIVFSPRFNLSNELRQRLISLYPHIKDLAYGEKPSQTLRTFFPSYLARFMSASNEAVKTELLNCMTKCLTTDKQSFSVWCQLYINHLAASGHLLEHINYEWDKLSSQFDKKLLKETLRSFSVTNEELENQGRGNRAGLGLCQAATKHLQARMTGHRFPWGTLLFLATTVVAAVVVFDILSSPKLGMSRTVQFLEHYGILAVLEQAWGRIHTFAQLSMEWMKLNCPLYYKYICETVCPILSMTWVALKDFAIEMELVTRPHRAWAVERAVHFYHWVCDLSPETWAWCAEVSWLVWEVLKDYTLRIWKHSVHFAEDVEHYLTHHVLTGALSKDSLMDTARWSFERIQNHTMYFWTWANTNFVATPN